MQISHLPQLQWTCPAHHLNQLIPRALLITDLPLKSQWQAFQVLNHLPAILISSSFLVSAGSSSSLVPLAPLCHWPSHFLLQPPTYVHSSPLIKQWPSLEPPSSKYLHICLLNANSPSILHLSPNSWMLLERNLLPWCISTILLRLLLSGSPLVPMWPNPVLPSQTSSCSSSQHFFHMSSQFPSFWTPLVWLPRNLSPPEFLHPHWPHLCSVPSAGFCSTSRFLNGGPWCSVLSALRSPAYTHSPRPSQPTSWLSSFPNLHIPPQCLPWTPKSWIHPHTWRYHLSIQRHLRHRTFVLPTQTCFSPAIPCKSLNSKA